jgi:hypothetical protein
MTDSTHSKGGVPLEVRATIADPPADFPTVAAYAFSKGGALLDRQALDKEGRAKLSIPRNDEPQAIRVVLGPDIDTKDVDVGEVLRRGGLDRHVAIRPRAETLPPIVFDVRPEIWRCWIGRLCVVKGTLLKRVLSGGVPLSLPVCAATVDIYEVDPWPRIIFELPDFELDRLREIVDGPWPPIRWPIPPPPDPFQLADLVADPLGPRGLNPQPLPPRARAGAIRGFNPQPDPPVVALRRQVAALPVELALGARAARPVFERAVVANLDLLRPILCWLYPTRVRRTRIATVTTDECGHFSAIIWRSCVSLDQPDLYFVARQRFWPGFWVTIYEPTPVACHTWWNYVCGTEVTLVTSHPWARACPPCPPVVAPNNWVLFMAIGNTSVWRIHGANTSTHVGAVGHDPAKFGLLDDAAPWGGTLRPRLEFDNSLRDSLGVKYYRVSYKRPSESDLEWRPSTEAVNRHYTHEVGGDLILEQYPLGPFTVGTSPHLYEIPPALPPTGQWSIPNAVLDTQSAVIPTTAVAPGVDFDETGTPAGPDLGGLWQIKVELFDAAGVQVDPEVLGIKWRVPESTDLTGTIQTEDASLLGLVDAARNCMIVTVRMDNNPCLASIAAPTLDGSAAADECGVMSYGSRASTVAMPFLALQRSRYATYSFYVQRGAVSPPEVDVPGTAAASAATMPPAPTESVANLLDACTTAGFVEHLRVWHMSTDGWSRQSQYDRFDVRAFVLAPTTP